MKTIILVLLISLQAYSQISDSEGGLLSKEYSKEKALYDSKFFLYESVLGSSNSPLKFEVDPLAASNSGELTTLAYKCDDKNKEGLILGFYGEYWNDNGVHYKGFSFKNLDKEKATEFISKIYEAIESQKKYLKDNGDENNIMFTYDDINVLIFQAQFGLQIRLFWKEFDSTWEKTAFDRSRRRFERKSTK